MAYGSQTRCEEPLSPHDLATSLTLASIRPSRSPHFVSRTEAIKGISNRFVFSTVYVWLYLSMALLS